jgi:hypothetical protein
LWKNKNDTLWDTTSVLLVGLMTFYSNTRPLDKSWHVMGLGYNPHIRTDDSRGRRRYTSTGTSSHGSTSPSTSTSNSRSLDYERQEETRFGVTDFIDRNRCYK